jgi:DNA replication protein DnaC
LGSSQEKLTGRGGKLADNLARLHLVVIDGLGYLPFSKNGGQFLFHVISNLYERKERKWLRKDRSFSVSVLSRSQYLL